MTNPKALEAMERHLNEALNGCQIELGRLIFESYDDALSRFTKEVLRTKGQWLSPTTIFRVFIDELHTVVNECFPKKDEISGLLRDLLDAEMIDRVVKKILDLVQSVPRSYHIFVPLPAATLGVEEVLITSDIALIEIHDKEKVPGGYRLEVVPTSLNSVSLQIDKPYLRLASTGYARTSIDDSAFQSAISRFKQLVYLGIMFKFFKKHEVTLTGFLFGRPYHEAIALDLEDPEHLKAPAPLPNSIADFINRISINHDLVGLKEAKESGKMGIEGFLNYQLRDPINLLTRKSGDINSAPIRSAVEWAFDAGINENPTVSFIQTCIGLESILGEDSDQETLTATLADRCAYLLGSNSIERNFMRKRFRELYRIRSKLVHGRVVNLSDEEIVYKFWAKFVLDRLIRKELASLRE